MTQADTATDTAALDDWLGGHLLGWNKERSTTLARGEWAYFDIDHHRYRIASGGGYTRDAALSTTGDGRAMIITAMVERGYVWNAGGDAESAWVEFGRSHISESYGGRAADDIQATALAARAAIEAEE